MKKSLFYFIIKLKKNLIAIISILFIFCLVIYSNENMLAVKEGLKLWVNSVIPSLFPFFIATEILCHTNIINSIGRLVQKPISKLFNVPRRRCFCLNNGDNKWISKSVQKLYQI